MKSYFISSILLMLLVSVVLSLGLILRPDSLSAFPFVIAMAWVLFLTVLNWGLLVSFFSSNRSLNGKNLLAILPTLQFITFLYSIFSVVTLLYFWSDVGYGALPKSHWVMQIILFALWGFIAILTIASAKTSELPEVKFNLMEKEQFLELLHRLRVSINDIDAAAELDGIERYIRYSMPHLSRLKNWQTYSEITNTLEILLKDSNNISDRVEFVKSTSLSITTCK